LHVIETTGVANPGPVIQTFFIVMCSRPHHSRMRSRQWWTRDIRLCLADTPAAAEQIAFADQIILNKTELVTGGELEAIEARCGSLNPIAPIHHARPRTWTGQAAGRRARQSALPVLEADLDTPHAATSAASRSPRTTPLDAQASGWSTPGGRSGQDILRGKGIFDLTDEDNA